MPFTQLNLHPKIVQAVIEAGYSKPTKIQLKAIPKIVNGFDIRASAQTGTGKTAAFLLPALNRLVTSPSQSGKGARVLVLVPTRELGMQIMTQTEKYSKYLRRVKAVCIGGGVPYHVQLRELSRPYDILIATPGRLIDLINRRKVHFSRLEMLVLDEADRMLDMGFTKPVEEIVGKTPSERQTLLFSATLQGNIIELSNWLLKDPLEITVKEERKQQDNIEHRLNYADDLHHKYRLLDHILSENKEGHIIVFTSTKRCAAQLSLKLQKEGYLAAALHGDMNQRQRTRTIGELRRGKVRILVATDVAARGIDVQSLTHVINFDLPQTIEDYVHRTGRTGRAGAKGTAISFVMGRDGFLIKDIKVFTNQRVSVTEIPGLEPRLPPRTPGPTKRRCSHRRKKFPPRVKGTKRRTDQRRNKGP